MTLLFAAVLGFSGALAFAAEEPTDNTNREGLATIFLNQTQVAEAMPILLVPRLGPVLHINEFEKLGLVDPKIRIAVRGVEDYVPLKRVVGLEASFNPRTLELRIQAEPKLLKNNVIAADPVSKSSPALASWGAFFNYDLLVYRAQQEKSLGGTLESVLFSPYGSFVHNQLLLKGEAQPLGAYDRKVRLESYFIHDTPEKLWRFRLGDSVTTSGSWGRQVRFGGLKFGTDFSLNPNFLSIPSLQLTGSATIPSTVDLFINNSLQRSYNVPAGPFSIDQVPVITGAGNARMVVRNVLGQDQIVELPFFRVPSQLKKGLADYAFEFGAIRKNFGLTSNDYGTGIAAGTLRYGVSDRLTAEVRVEASRGGDRNLGVSAVIPFAAGFSINPGVVSSQSALGAGSSAFLTMVYSGPTFSVSARSEGSSEHYQQLGFGPTELAFARRNFVSASARLAKFTSLGVTYLDNLSRTDGRLRILSANLNTRITSDLYASTSISRSLGQTPNTTLSFLLNWVGADGRQASLNAQSQRSEFQESSLFTARYGQRPDYRGGYGYDFELGSQDRARARGEVLGESGEAAIEASRLTQGQGTASRITARGALIVADGALKTSRFIDDSFIVVKAPEVPGAKVSRGGSREVTLDANGRAVIDRIQSYAPTQFDVVATSLPMDATLGPTTESRVSVRARAGRVIDLAVKRNRSVTLKLVHNGKPVASGATIEYAGKLYPVGLDGLVFILEIGKGGIGKVTDGASACKFEVKPLVGEEMLPDLGEIACIAG